MHKIDTQLLCRHLGFHTVVQWCSRQSCRYSLVPVTVPPAGERLVKQSKIIGEEAA